MLTRQYLSYFNDRRLIAIFLFGIASGFPWVIIGSAMTAWLTEANLSRSAIGFFGAVFAAYSFNFIWSPLLDRLKLPVLFKLLGIRRSWIVFTQSIVVVGCIYLSQVDVVNHLYLAGLIAMIIAVASATQDIAIDAFRIDSIPKEEKEKMAAGAAMATSGWWTGFGGLGSIPFFIADLPNWSWSEIYLVLAAIMATLMFFAMLATEPVNNRDKVQQQAISHYFQDEHSRSQKLMNWLAVTLVEPFREFFVRNGVKTAVILLLFIFLFKIGEAYLGRMSVVFYKEVGFSNTDIGIYSKLLNWWLTILFAVVSSLFTMRFGIVKGLIISGIAMSASNLMFALIAIVGPDKNLFALTVIVDGFTGAWASVAFVAFISLMCNSAFTASQYALMASLGTLGRTTLGSFSGLFVDTLDGNWPLFFVITALMVVPSLVLLFAIRDKIKQIQTV